MPEQLHFLQVLLDTIPVPLFYNDLNGIFLGCNKAYEEFVGLARGEILGKTCYEVVSKDPANKSLGNDLELWGRSGLKLYETPTFHADGTRREAIMSTSTFTNLDGTPAGLIGVLVDITPQKEAEAKLVRLNRLYSLLLKINEAIVRLRDTRILFEQVCRIAVEEGMFRLAWVGLMEEDSQQVKPVAHFGFEDGYLDLVHLAAAVPGGRGPMGTAIRTGSHEVCNDFAKDPRREPWRVEGLKRGYRSAIAFPLRAGTKTVGALTLYAGEPNFFKEDEVQLLESLVTDLSFALEAAAQEEQRRQAVEALRLAKEVLEAGMAERAAAFKEATARLTATARELEQRHREISLLSQMSEVLQSCRQVKEAYTVIAHSLGQLFPTESGALFMFSPSRHLVEAVTVWGEAPPAAQMFSPEDCWALRLGRVQVTADSGVAPRCPHLKDESRTSFCLPLIAQGEVVGTLHLLVGAAEAGGLEAKRHLATNVADRISLALANLRLQENLRHLSIRDPLTGLFNRRYLEETLEREVRRAHRHGRTLAVIIADLDHFKFFNDTFGHDAGDALLRELGALLQQQVRGSDIACRYGGEEFTVVLAETASEAVRPRAEQVREAIKGLRVKYGQRSLPNITISLGVAVFPEHGATPHDLLLAADAALYRAKQQGRDQVCVAGE